MSDVFVTPPAPRSVRPLAPSGRGWRIFSIIMSVALVMSVVVNLVLFLFVVVLGAGLGSDIEIEAEGPQAAEALAAIEAMVAAKFDEGE